MSCARSEFITKGMERTLARVQRFELDYEPTLRMVTPATGGWTVLSLEALLQPKFDSTHPLARSLLMGEQGTGKTYTALTLVRRTLELAQSDDDASFAIYVALGDVVKALDRDDEAREMALARVVAAEIGVSTNGGIELLDQMITGGELVPVIDQTIDVGDSDVALRTTEWVLAHAKRHGEFNFVLIDRVPSGGMRVLA